MFAEYKQTIRRLRGQAIGWSIGIGLFALLLGSFYDTVSTMEGLEELMQGYPQDILAFFDGIQAITTPWGYLHTEFFTLISMIIGIFAIGSCVKLIVGDEEKGVLDLVLAYPVSRLGLFWGRLLAFTTVMIGILLATWLTFVIPSSAFGFDLTPEEFLRPFISLFATLMFFGTLALLLSLTLPSTRLASMFAGLLMVGNFLFIGLSNINTDLQPYLKYTPLHYYQGGEAIKELRWDWAAGLLITSLLFSLLACIALIRRDIRVSGEHSWLQTTATSKKKINEIIEKSRQFLVQRLFHRTEDREVRQPGKKPVDTSEKKSVLRLVIYTFLAMATIVVSCLLVVIIIDAADLWCTLFSGFFNSISYGACP